MTTPYDYLMPTENEDGEWVVQIGLMSHEALKVRADGDHTVQLAGRQGHHGEAPVAWTISSAEARQLAGSLTLAADQADGIDI